MSGELLGRTCWDELEELKEEVRLLKEKLDEVERERMCSACYRTLREPELCRECRAEGVKA